GYSAHVLSFANSIHTSDGGMHEKGFRSALTRALMRYGDKSGILEKAKIKLDGEDVREGLTAIVSLQIPQPQFDSQTKSRLTSIEAKGFVEQLVYDGLSSYFDENPKAAKAVIGKTIQALGDSIGQDLELSKLRYHKCIIMSVDGAEHVFVRDGLGVRMVRIGDFIDAIVDARGGRGEGVEKVQDSDLGEVLCFGQEDM